MEKILKKMRLYSKVKRNYFELFKAASNKHFKEMLKTKMDLMCFFNWIETKEGHDFWWNANKIIEAEHKIKEYE